MSTFNELAPTVSQILNASNVFVYGNTSTGNALSVQQLGAGNVFVTSNTNGSIGIFVNARSNVGIGTTNPSQLLDIYGGANTALRIRSSAVGAVRNVGISLENSNSTTPSGIYMDGADKMAFYTFGAARMSIDYTGYVGIGTGSPGAQLQIGGTGVTGNVLQIGNFTFQMVSYQGLFGAGTVTYTPSASGLFVAYFAYDVLVFTSAGTGAGQYSATTTYINSASLSGNGGFGQLSLSTAVNGALTATFKNTGGYMTVFRMAF